MSALIMGAPHRNLPAGTTLKHAHSRVRIATLTEDDGRGSYGCRYVRKDGEPDQRYAVGFSAVLRETDWTVEGGST
jgi:hypothetical protein